MLKVNKPRMNDDYNDDDNNNNNNNLINNTDSFASPFIPATFSS
jgi:hypothetical protein